MIASATKPAVMARARTKPYQAETFVGKECVGALITRSKTQLWEAMERALSPYKITLSQWIVLDNLFHGTGMTPADICQEVGYDPGAMTRLLDKLERNRFIRRRRNPGDRRSVQLELTAAGRRLHPKLLAVVVAEMNTMVVGLSVAQTRLLEKFLRRVLANARARTAQPRGDA